MQKNRAEVVAMSIFEYNEEEEKRKPQFHWLKWDYLCSRLLRE